MTDVRVVDGWPVHSGVDGDVVLVKRMIVLVVIVELDGEVMGESLLFAFLANASRWSVPARR